MWRPGVVHAIFVVDDEGKIEIVVADDAFALEAKNE